MSFSNFLQKQEDEMDFIPIIPLNETSSENLDGIEVPAEIPLLPLRNTVLFPGVVLPITVGRDKSIKAVNDAYKADKLIGVIAQKDSIVEEPVIKDLEDIGTVAKIVKLIKMPDGGTTIIIQGKSRFRIESIVEEEPYFRATKQNWKKKNRQKIRILKLMFRISKILQLISFSFHRIFLLKLLLFCAILRTLPFLIHFVSSNLNTDIKEKQRLLELNHIREKSRPSDAIAAKRIAICRIKK